MRYVIAALSLAVSNLAFASYSDDCNAEIAKDIEAVAAKKCLSFKRMK